MVSVAPRTRPAYPPEFRREAIELLRAARSPSELAERLGVSPQTLRNWRRQDKIDRHERDDGVTTDERAELGQRRPDPTLSLADDVAVTTRTIDAASEHPSSSSATPTAGP